MACVSRSGPATPSRPAPGEWHWHSAAPGTFMDRLAVTDDTTEWAGQVTVDEYQG
jgi:hypothetical protein